MLTVSREALRASAWLIFLFVLYDISAEIRYYYDGWFVIVNDLLDFEWLGFPRNFTENAKLHFFIDALGLYLWWRLK